MKIEFDQTIEDLADFHLFNAANNPTFQRQLFAFKLMKSFFALLFPIGLFYLLLGKLTAIAVTIGVLAAILVFLLDPQSQKRATFRRVNKTFSDPKNKTMLGRQSILLSAEGVFIKTQLSESKLEWLAFDRVAQNDRNIFVYLGPVNAIVIPRRCFQSAHEQQDFIDYLNSHIQHK